MGFFIWPNTDSIWHQHIGELLGNDGILSAGFVQFNRGMPKCFGESETICLGSLPEDSDLLAKHFDIDTTS